MLILVCILVSVILPVQSQCRCIHIVHANVLIIFYSVSVTWNGSIVASPVMIYHDEITPNASSIDDPNSHGALTCRSEVHVEVAWYFLNNSLLPDGASRSGKFYQIKTPNISQVSRVTEISMLETDDIYNGLFYCHSIDSVEKIAVGLYHRQEGK